VLQALGIRSYVMRDPQDAQELIQRAQILTEDAKRPVALLLTKEVLGRRAPLKSLWKEALKLICRRLAPIKIDEEIWLFASSGRIRRRSFGCQLRGRRDFGMERAQAVRWQLSGPHSRALLLDRARHGARIAAS